MPRQNQAIRLIDSLIKELQEMVINEHSMSTGHIQSVILQLRVIKETIK